MGVREWWRRGTSGDPGANFALVAGIAVMVGFVLLITAALTVWALIVSADRAAQTSLTNQELIRLICDTADEHGSATQLALNKLLTKHGLETNAHPNENRAECERTVRVEKQRQPKAPSSLAPVFIGVVAIVCAIAFIIWRQRRKR